MLPVVRYVVLLLFMLISLHFIVSFTHEDYGRATSFSHLKDQFIWHDPHFLHDTLVDASSHPPNPTGYIHPAPAEINLPRRANATLLMLARNSDVDSAVASVRALEDRFNHKFGYPWVFLNEVPFDSEFVRRITNVIKSPVSFGVIPHDHWFQPDWIDEERATAGRDKMVADDIIYGGSVSYRNMCRFNSGFFYRHPLLQQYKWYWRVEPGINYHCDMTYDPFLYMEDNDKLYGFTITMYEYWATIPTLWDTVRQFVEQFPRFINPDNAMSFISTDGGWTYNLCHFWSNFEIASMDLWRSEAYTKFFEYLDATGGFYYERWGDAPVHSIGAALFARADQIHLFEDYGYEHPPYTHCPRDHGQWLGGKCSCNPGTSFDYDGVSCMAHWDRFQSMLSWKKQNATSTNSSVAVP